MCEWLVGRFGRSISTAEAMSVRWAARLASSALALVLGCCMLAGQVGEMGVLAQESAPGETGEQAGRLPKIERIWVPADSVGSIFPAATELRGLSRDEFDRLEQAARAGLSRSSDARPARLLRASHQATWDQGVLRGRTELRVEIPPAVFEGGDPGEDHQRGSWLPLTPWSPAVLDTRPGVAEPGIEGAELLGAPDGRVGLLLADAAAAEPRASRAEVASTRSVTVRWEVVARAGTAGRVFAVSLPRVPISEWLLDLPGELTPDVAGAIRHGPLPSRSAGWNRWRFDRASGELVVRLRQSRDRAATAGAARLDSTMWIHGPTWVEVEASHATWLAEWMVDPGVDGPRTLEVMLDPGLELIDVEGTSVVAFQAQPAAAEHSSSPAPAPAPPATRLTIRLAKETSEPAQVKLRALAHVPLEGNWQVPAARPLNGTWTGGQTLIRLDRRRLLTGCRELAGRRTPARPTLSSRMLRDRQRTSGPQPDPDGAVGGDGQRNRDEGGQWVVFDTTAPGSVAELSFRSPAPSLSAEVLGWFRLDSAIPRLECLLTWNLHQGPLLDAQIELPAGWVADEVRILGSSSPPLWHTESSETSTGRSVLHVNAPPGLTDRAKFVLRLRAHGPVVSPNAPFSLPRVRPLGVSLAEERWSVWTDGMQTARPVHCQGMAWLDLDRDSVLDPVNQSSTVSEPRAADGLGMDSRSSSQTLLPPSRSETTAEPTSLGGAGGSDLPGNPRPVLAWRWIDPDAQLVIVRSAVAAPPRASVAVDLRLHPGRWEAIQGILIDPDERGLETLALGFSEPLPGTNTLSWLFSDASSGQPIAARVERVSSAEERSTRGLPEIGDWFVARIAPRSGPIRAHTVLTGTWGDQGIRSTNQTDFTPDQATVPQGLSIPILGLPAMTGTSGLILVREHPMVWTTVEVSPVLVALAAEDVAESLPLILGNGGPGLDPPRSISLWPTPSRMANGFVVTGGPARLRLKASLLGVVPTPGFYREARLATQPRRPIDSRSSGNSRHNGFEPGPFAPISIAQTGDAAWRHSLELIHEPGTRPEILLPDMPGMTIEAVSVDGRSARPRRMPSGDLVVDRPTNTTIGAPRSIMVRIDMLGRGELPRYLVEPGSAPQSSLWNLTAPQGMVVEPLGDRLTALDRPPLVGPLERLLQGNLALAPARSFSLSSMSMSPSPPAKSSSQEIRLIDWLRGWDQPRLPLVIDRLALAGLGLGPASTLRVPSEATELGAVGNTNRRPATAPATRDPIESLSARPEMLASLGITQVVVHGIRLITSREEVLDHRDNPWPWGDSSSQYWTTWSLAIRAAALLGSDGTDRFQDVTRFAGEPTPYLSRSRSNPSMEASTVATRFANDSMTQVKSTRFLLETDTVSLHQPEESLVFVRTHAELLWGALAAVGFLILGMFGRVSSARSRHSLLALALAMGWLLGRGWAWFSDPAANPGSLAVLAGSRAGEVFLTCLLLGASLLATFWLRQNLSRSGRSAGSTSSEHGPRRERTRDMPPAGSLDSGTASRVSDRPSSHRKRIRSGSAAETPQREVFGPWLPLLIVALCGAVISANAAGQNAPVASSANSGPPATTQFDRQPRANPTDPTATSEILVLLPYDPDRFPAPELPTDRVVLRLVDYERLLAMASLSTPTDSPGVGVLSARHRLTEQGELLSEYDLLALPKSARPGVASSTEWRWTFPVGDARDLAATLDGQPVPVRIEPGGASAWVRIERPGTHRLALSLRCRRAVTTLGETLNLPIVAAANARILVEPVADFVLREISGCELAPSLAPAGVAAATSRYEGRLGPEPRLNLTWRSTTATTPTRPATRDTIEGLAIWDVEPTGELLRLRWTLRRAVMTPAPEGVAELRIAHEPNVVVRPLKVPGLIDVQGQGTADAPIWVARVDPPLQPGTVIELEAWRPRPVPISNTQASTVRILPRVEPLDVATYFGAVALRRPPHWRGRIDNEDLDLPWTDEQFVRAWGRLPDDSLTFAGTTRFNSTPRIQVDLTPQAERTMLRPRLALKIEAGRILVHGEASWTENPGQWLDLELAIPPALVLTRLSADGLTAWTRPAPDQLRLRFDTQRPAQGSIRWDGWIRAGGEPNAPRPSESRASIPWPTFANASSEIGTLTIDAPLETSLAFDPEPETAVLTAAPSKQPNPLSDIAASSSAAGYNRWEFNVLDPSTLPALVWSPSSSRANVRVESHLILGKDQVLWGAAVRYQIRGGPLDALLLRIPAPWSRPDSTSITLLDAAQPYTVSSSISRDDVVWTIRPRQPATSAVENRPLFWSEVTVLIHARRPLPRDATIEAPDVVPLGQGTVETLLAVRDASGQTVTRSSLQGLKPLDPSERSVTRFATPDASAAPWVAWPQPREWYSVSRQVWSLRFRVADPGPVPARLIDVTTVVHPDGDCWGESRFHLGPRPPDRLRFLQDSAARAQPMLALVDGHPTTLMRDHEGHWHLAIDKPPLVRSDASRSGRDQGGLDSPRSPREASLVWFAPGSVGAADHLSLPRLMDVSGSIPTVVTVWGPAHPILEPASDAQLQPAPAADLQFARLMALLAAGSPAQQPPSSQVAASLKTEARRLLASIDRLERAPSWIAWPLPGLGLSGKYLSEFEAARRVLGETSAPNGSDESEGQPGPAAPQAQPVSESNHLSLLGTPRWYQGATRPDGSIDPLRRRTPRSEPEPEPAIDPGPLQADTPIWTIHAVDLTPWIAALLLLITSLVDRFIATSSTNDRRSSSVTSDAIVLLGIGGLTTWLVPPWLILFLLLMAPVWLRAPFHRTA